MTGPAGRGAAMCCWRRRSPATRSVLIAGVALDALMESAVAHTYTGDRIEVSVWLEGSNAVIGVTDSGGGIPPADLERIFRRFARAEPYRSRETGGFGLGLPVVQAIAEAHHGSVLVHSAGADGSTFELVTPVVPGSASVVPADDDPACQCAAGLRPGSGGTGAGCAYTTAEFRPAASSACWEQPPSAAAGGPK
jgi:hypothetical protein